MYGEEMTARVITLSHNIVTVVVALHSTFHQLGITQPIRLKNY